MTTSTVLTGLRSLIIDLDGVIYRGKTPIPGAREFLRFLHCSHVSFLLLTNNSTLTAAQYVDKLSNMRVEVEQDCILTSAEATARYLASAAPPGTTVYAIGEDGVRWELEKRGFLIREDTDVAYVVVGFDRHITYEKMATAALAIRAGARFIGTNPDTTYPSELGQMPGNGAMLAAIEAATEVAPLIVGKPESAIFELALAKLGAEAATTAVVGDRLDTDIVGGRRAGLLTILMLSGVTSAKQLASASPSPDLVFNDLSTLHAAWLEATAA
jgi:4-nitrophenyl phosphatase